MAAARNLFCVSLVILCLSQQGLFAAETCKLSDINVRQSKTGKVVEGEPEYEVVIENHCGCPQSNVVLRTTGFGSIRPVDPKIFKQINYHESLINGGRAIVKGSPIKFKYVWLTPYDLIPEKSTPHCN